MTLLETIMAQAIEDGRERRRAGRVFARRAVSGRKLRQASVLEQLYSPRGLRGGRIHHLKAIEDKLL